MTGGVFEAQRAHPSSLTRLSGISITFVQMLAQICLPPGQTITLPIFLRVVLCLEKRGQYNVVLHHLHSQVMIVVALKKVLLLLKVKNLFKTFEYFYKSQSPRLTDFLYMLAEISKF